MSEPMNNKNVCGKPTVGIMVWPDMTQLPVCEEHSLKLQAIANAMGFRIGFLPADLGLTCTQVKSSEEQRGNNL